MGRREDVNHLKFLFDAFLPEYYWTEVMECLRKLLLTGFVVFFYEGSGLQVIFGMVVSMVFLALYAFLQPYLMPSNNTFASYVHFQISFTLLLTLLIRVNENLSSSEVNNFKISSQGVSFALLASAVSVLVLGVFMIIKVLLTNSSEDSSSLGVNSPQDSKDGKKSRKSSKNSVTGDERMINQMRRESAMMIHGVQWDDASKVDSNVELGEVYGKRTSKIDSVSSSQSKEYQTLDMVNEENNSKESNEPRPKSTVVEASKKFKNGGSKMKKKKSIKLKKKKKRKSSLESKKEEQKIELD